MQHNGSFYSVENTKTKLHLMALVSLYYTTLPTIKETFNQNKHLLKIYSEFSSLSEQIWRNLALHNLLNNWSPAVNSAVWMCIDITIIQVIDMTPVHQFTSCDMKSCIFVIIKIHQDIWTSDHCFQSSIRNIAFYSGKSNLVWIRREICTDQAPFTSKKQCWYSRFWCEKTTGDGL